MLRLPVPRGSMVDTCRLRSREPTQEKSPKTAAKFHIVQAEIKPVKLQAKQSTDRSGTTEECALTIESSDDEEGGCVVMSAAMVYIGREPLGPSTITFPGLNNRVIEVKTKGIGHNAKLVTIPLAVAEVTGSYARLTGSAPLTFTLATCSEGSLARRYRHTYAPRDGEVVFVVLEPLTEADRAVAAVALHRALEALSAQSVQLVSAAKSAPASGASSAAEASAHSLRSGDPVEQALETLSHAHHAEALAALKEEPRAALRCPARFVETPHREPMLSSLRSPCNLFPFRHRTSEMENDRVVLQYPKGNRAIGPVSSARKPPALLC